MLTLSGVSTFYGETQVLRDLSLEVRKGAVIALLGRNGMGKTTTIRSIIGFTPPRQGRIQFKGKDITGLKPFRVTRMGIGLVPQGRHIFPSLSVTENLTMSARNCKQPGAWTLERIHGLFPILKDRAKLRANLLSGGEQQMLCIGRALLTNPDLILLDEPSEGLAVLLVREVGEIISRLKNDGISILLVEQNLSLALSVADYIYIISKGEIVHEATPQDLVANEEIKAQHLGLNVKSGGP